MRALSNVDVTDFVNAMRREVQDAWERVDQIALANQRKVLKAFHTHRISEYHFASGTGYGYNDAGRDALEAVYAQVFGAEAAFVRPLLASGTHAISACLFGLLRPGDELLSITGLPYDTMQQVIGLVGDNPSSLIKWGVNYRYLPLKDGKIDVNATIGAIRPETKVVAIQRSRGYSWRPSLSVGEIGAAIRAIKRAHPQVLVFVDNCYGEFAEEMEPCTVGADLVAGSLIKNPGAGLAPAGGYIVGRSDLVELAADAAVAPAIGMRVGAMFGLTRTMLQGLFLAPHTVAQAIKGAILLAKVMEELGYEVTPAWSEPRHDIVQAVRLGSPERLVAFCQAVQSAGPVDHYVLPEPGEMPGYKDYIVMAAGTFIQGASIELSADGPLRDPYIAYVQGGLTVEHCQIAAEAVVKALTSETDLP